MLRYTVLLHKNEETAGYSALIPELPGCFSHGDSLEEALNNAKEAIECHLEAMIADDEDVPVEREPFIVASVMTEVVEVKEVKKQDLLGTWDIPRLDQETIFSLIKDLEEALHSIAGADVTSNEFWGRLNNIAGRIDDNHLGVGHHDDPNVNRILSIAILLAAWLGCIPKSKLYATSEERPELDDQKRRQLAGDLRQVGASIVSAYLAGTELAKKLRLERPNQAVYDDWEKE